MTERLKVLFVCALLAWASPVRSQTSPRMSSAPTLPSAVQAAPAVTRIANATLRAFGVGHIDGMPPGHWANVYFGIRTLDGRAAPDGIVADSAWVIDGAVGFAVSLGPASIPEACQEQRDCVAWSSGMQSSEALDSFMWRPPQGGPSPDDRYRFDIVARLRDADGRVYFLRAAGRRFSESM